jgi:hypothetical protein
MMNLFFLVKGFDKETTASLKRQETHDSPQSPRRPQVPSSEETASPRSSSFSLRR